MLSNLASQFQRFWQRQSSTQKMLLIGIVVALAILIPVLATWASTPSYSVAFSGLRDEDAGQIVEKLKTENIPYQLSSGGAIMVPSDKVYEVRLMMAREGIPSGGSVGYELFSGNTLGMTEFTQRVNYQRALEGELERTIGSLEPVQVVRVHIVTPEKRLLTGDQAPTTASVTIQEKPGKYLDEAQVRAITFLVANSVEGLNSENVVVVDTEGNLLAAGMGENKFAGSIAQMNDRQSVEREVAASLQKKVKNLLDMAIGENKSVVQVNVNMDWTEREVTTQSFDPETTAIRSSQKITESYSSNGGTIAGIPGAETNLPNPVTEAGEGSEGPSAYNRTEETINYEVTTTQSYQIFHPGQVERVSLSVLVDGVSDPQQLEILESAIAAAAGIDLARGDVISVQSLEFDRVEAERQAAELEQQLREELYIKVGIGVGVFLLVLMLFLYINRLLRNLRIASVEVWSPVLKQPEPEKALPAAAAMQAAAPQLAAPLEAVPQLAEQPVGASEEELSQVVPSEIVKQLTAAKSEEYSIEEEQMQRVVTRYSEDSPASVAEIIQLWLNQDKQQNA